LNQPGEVTSQAVRRELRAAIRELRDGGLHRAATWAAEQLVGLRGNDPLCNPAAAAGLSQPERHVNCDDTDAMLLARRFFDGKVQHHWIDHVPPVEYAAIVLVMEARVLVTCCIMSM
jgi:hypothetical protein